MEPDRQPPSQLRHGSSRSDVVSGISAGGAGILDFPESRNRRILELKLLHQYITKTSLTIASDPARAEAWTNIIPNLAFTNDALLYSMYSASALHLAKVEPQDPEALDSHRRYLDLALREHSNDVAQLNKANADIVCLTSSLLRMCAFVMLQDRPLNPYEPPMQWLHMTSRAVTVFKEAWKWIGDDQNSIASILVRRMPIILDDEAKYGEHNRKGLLHLLRPSQRPESWDADIQDAYESTISYIGSIMIAITTQVEQPEIFRRIIAFPMLIKRGFIYLVEQRQPRALVVLAHYFALCTMLKKVWWIGDVGPREVRGIQMVLSDEWLDLMCWPLQTIEQGIIPT
jgi:hypothetical protein